jgi:hypothetical protein
LASCAVGHIHGRGLPRRPDAATIETHEEVAAAFAHGGQPRLHLFARQDLPGQGVGRDRWYERGNGGGGIGDHDGLDDHADVLQAGSDEQSRQAPAGERIGERVAPGADEVPGGLRVAGPERGRTPVRVHRDDNAARAGDPGQLGGGGLGPLEVL